MWLVKCAQLIEKFSNPASRIVNSVGAIVLAIMMFIVALDVSLRYIFVLPIKGSYELVELTMVVSVFLAVAYTASQKGHVAVDFVAARLPQRAMTIIDIITCFLSLGLVSVMVWRTVVRANIAWVQNQGTAVLVIPLYPFLFLVAFGFTLLAIVLLADLLNLVAKAGKR